MSVGVRSLDFLVVGDLFVDLVMSGFPSWPPNPGEEVFAEQFCREAGGGAAITACGLTKLGAKAGVMGVVGETDGQWLTDRLESSGVNTSAIQRNPLEPTAVTVSISSPKDRTFLTYMGANRGLPQMLKQFGSQDECAKARHVHLACAPEPAEVANLLGGLAEQGCSVSVDAGWHPEWLADAHCKEALRHVDIFMPNEREAAVMTGEIEPQQILEAFQKMGLKRVALKLGARGAALLSDGKIMFCAPLNVKSIDSTGAGDSFDAGFLFAWLRGDGPQKCLKIATICGALSTRRFGGIAGFPSIAELKAELEARK
ncbi:MAG: carbohydrate kinase family protein [Acidobacteriota bacterium]|nr:carbohydrate kinase family protein [Acidobacteriota bacterium]